MALHTIGRGPYRAVIDSMGAQLMNLAFEGREYLWQGDPRWWKGRAPILFPIVGSLRDNKAMSAEGPVSLERHGLARLHEHAVLSKTDTRVVFELASTDAMLARYPYPFRLRTTFELGAGGLVQTFEVCNAGAATMPFAVGGHPAFNVPISGTAGAFEDHAIRFAEPWSSATPWLDKGTGLIDCAHSTTIAENSAVWRLDRAPFDHDTIILEDVPGRTATLTLAEDGAHGVTVDFADFRYLGIWSPADAPMIAIEPWTGIATCLDDDDVFEHKRNTQFAGPGEQKTYSFSIKPF